MRHELARPARAGAEQPIFVSTSVRHFALRLGVVAAAAVVVAAVVVVLALVAG